MAMPQIENLTNFKVWLVVYPHCVSCFKMIFQFWFVVKPSGQSNHVWSQPVSDQWWPSDGICSDLDAGQGPIWYRTTIWYQTSIQHLHQQWWFTIAIYFVISMILQISAIVSKIQWDPRESGGASTPFLLWRWYWYSILQWCWYWYNMKYWYWYWYCTGIILILALVVWRQKPIHYDYDNFSPVAEA